MSRMSLKNWRVRKSGDEDQSGREDTGTTEEYDTDTGKGRQKELQIPNTRLRRIRKIHISIIRRTDPEMKR